MMRLKAQITVYAALSLGLVLSFVCTCIQSVKLIVADTEINMAARISTESVFAGYNNKLLDEFGIFALSENQCSDSKLDYYARSNVANAAVKSFIGYKKSFISERQYMTDNGGYGLEKQVEEYMRAGGYANIVKDYLDIDAETKKAEKIGEVTSKVEIVNDKLYELDKTDKKLVRVIRSIDAVSPGLIADIQEDINLYQMCIKEDDRYGAQDCVRAYETNYNALLSQVSEVMEKCIKAKELIGEYDDYDNEADKLIDDCRGTVESGTAQLQELTGIIRNDIDDIAMQKEIEREKLCNKARIKPILENNIAVCERIIQQLGSMGTLSLYSSDRLYAGYMEIQSMISDMDIAGLSSECADVDIDTKGEGTGALKKIRQVIDDGIAGIVLNGMDIKHGKFKHSGLATEYMNSQGRQEAGMGFNGVTGAVVDSALFNAYIFDRFPSYIDVHNSNESDDWSEISYAVEYILAGNDNDISNLNEVILKLSALREAANFTYIIMDSGKRNEALMLATTLVGASGNAAAIKAAQYVIMGVWSYGESIVDVRRLLKGDKLNIIKDNSDWQLSLENLLKMNFDGDNISGKTGSQKSGLSYEDYLGMLLLMMNQTTRNYRVMQAMELRIIALGQQEFRMKKYIYEAECNILAVINMEGRVNHDVNRTQKYSYAA